MTYKPRIKLIVATDNGVSTSEIKAPNVTDAMFDAAWDLIYTMSTNKRRKPAPRFKQYREKNEREAAKAKLARKTRNAKRAKDVRAARARRARERRGNADSTGIQSMVEGNRDDHQT